jgi:hypothetical protein
MVVAIITAVVAIITAAVAIITVAIMAEVMGTDTMVVGTTVIGTLEMAATGTVAGTLMAWAPAGVSHPLVGFGFAVTELWSKRGCAASPSQFRAERWAALTAGSLLGYPNTARRPFAVRSKARIMRTLDGHRIGPSVSLNP